jgi:hypothetical protein
MYGTLQTFVLGNILKYFQFAKSILRSELIQKYTQNQKLKGISTWTHKNLDEHHVHNQNRGFKSDVPEGKELPAPYTSAFKSASLSHIATMIFIWFRSIGFLKFKYTKAAIQRTHNRMTKFGLVWFFMVFNATFNNISAISWRSLLLVEEIGGPGENHAPTCRKSGWQTLSRCTPRPERESNDDQKKKYNRTNNGQYNTLYRKLKIEQNEPHWQPGLKLTSSGRVDSSCSTCDHRLLTIPIGSLRLIIVVKIYYNKLSKYC